MSPGVPPALFGYSLPKEELIGKTQVTGMDVYILLLSLTYAIVVPKGIVLYVFILFSFIFNHFLLFYFIFFLFFYLTNRKEDNDCRCGALARHIPNRGKKDGFPSPFPPNVTGEFLALRSPVDCFLIRTDKPKYEFLLKRKTQV